MKKVKLLFLLALLLVAPLGVAGAKKATLFHPTTNDRVAVNVGSQEAQQYFADDYVLETSYGYVENDDEMLGFNVITDYYKYLSQSMDATQTTIPVTSLETTDGHTLSFSDLGNKVFLTIDPDSDDYREIVMCTAITGTSWSSCTRGLSFYSTSTASVAANRKTHNSGAIVIMSNVAQVFEEFMDKDSDETIGGAKTFSGTVDFSTVTPTVPVAAPTANDEIANKKYVDDTITAGAPDGTETTKGIWEGATRIEMASSTATGGTSAGLLLKSEYATSSPDVRGLNVIISENDGYIDSDWLRLSDDLAFSGTNTHSGENTFSDDTIFSATTTLADITSGHTVSALIASTTITGATTPQPVYIGGDSGGVLLSDANDTDALDFTGFAITSATASGTVYVQTDGIVNGFTGLTPTSKYYVQDAVGTIGASIGTHPILVGIAISATELLIQKGTRTRYMTDNSTHVAIAGGTNAKLVTITCGFRAKRIYGYAEATYAGAGVTSKAEFECDGMLNQQCHHPSDSSKNPNLIMHGRMTTIYDFNGNSYLKIINITDTGFDVQIYNTGNGSVTVDSSDLKFWIEGY